MPVAGGPFIQKTGLAIEVDAANAASYPGTGTTWNNLINPRQYNGILTGSISYSTTDSYGALQFPGNNSYVDFGNIGDLSTSWSFQVAVKPVPSASGNYTILSYASGSNTGSWTFKLDYSSSAQIVTLSSYSVTGTNQIVHKVTGSVSTGSWSIINASYGNQILGMYINGSPMQFVLTTGSSVGYTTNNRLYLGGTFGITSSYYSGSISSLISYNTTTSNPQIVKNYNAYSTRYNLVPSILAPVATDVDALRFIGIANIVNAAQATAISNLVVGMKAAGIWDNVIAIYPIIGGTAYSHKFNLKDPRDADAAYRLSFAGGWTHSSTGALPNGTNTYAETYWGVNNLLVTYPDMLENIHIAFYNRTTETRTSTTEGTTGQHGASFLPSNQAAVRYTQNYGGTTTQVELSARNTRVGFSHGGVDYGAVVGSRIGTTTNVFKNGTLQASSTYSSLSPTGELTFKLGGFVDRGSIQGYTTSEICFVSLGRGLTNTQAATYTNLIEAFQSAVGRKA